MVKVVRIPGPSRIYQKLYLVLVFGRHPKTVHSAVWSHKEWNSRLSLLSSINCIATAYVASIAVAWTGVQLAAKRMKPSLRGV